MMNREQKEKILEVSDLHVSYGAVKALKGVSLDVYKGEIVAILGANGAGKTTFLRTVSSLVKSQEGTISYVGNDITKLEPELITKRGISQSPEGRQVFPELTVEENLMVGAFTLNDKKEIEKNLQRVFKYFPILKERYTQISSTLSGGEQQMLAIGRALMNSPKLLLLDEPSLGLAPLIVRDILNIVDEISEEGTTVIIVEQNAAQTLKIADYAYVFEVGRVSAQGYAQDLLNDASLIEAYLGT